MMKILLAVDGSPYTKKMLAYLAAHDELLGNGARHAYTVITVQAALPPGKTPYDDEGWSDNPFRCLYALNVYSHNNNSPMYE